MSGWLFFTLISLVAAAWLERPPAGTSCQDVAAWDQLQVFGLGDSIEQIAYSPAGERLAIVRSQGVVIWNLEQGEAERVLEVDPWVRSVVWLPDGAQLASVSVHVPTATVTVWDVETGTLLRTTTLTSPYPVLSLERVAWSPDGARLAGSQLRDVNVWDAETGALLRTLFPHMNRVTSVAWSPDGAQLASGSGDSTVKVWDVDTGTPLRTLTGHTSTVWSVAWSLEGCNLASGSGDGTVRIWGRRP